MKILHKILEHKNKIAKAFAVIVFFAMIMVINYCFIFSKGEKNIINVDDNYGQEVEWTVNTEKTLLPVNIKGVAKGTNVISARIPEYIGDDWGIMVYSLYSNVKAFVNDKQVFSYADTPSVPIGNMTGNVRLIIPIDSSMAGQKVSIHFIPYYSINMDIQQPAFGTIGQLKASVLKENMAAIMMCIFMILVLIVSIGLVLYELKCHTLKDIDLILNFGLFVALVLTWVMCDSNIGQFITDDAGPISITSFMCLAAMGVPFSGFCAIVLPKGKRIFRTYWLIGLIDLAVNIICFLTGICDPMVLLPVSHAIMILGVISSVIFAVRSWKLGSDEKILCVGLICIASGAIAAIVMFIVAPSMGYSAMAFSFGFLIFFFLGLWVLFRRQVSNIQEAKFIETYKKLAYTDVMTDLANRTSFETKMTSLCEDNMSGKAMALIIFDINNLKETNDTIGHQAGDKLVKTAAESIIRTFNEYGECYRLGGDEFAVVLTNPVKQVDAMLSEFDKAVEYFNKYHAYALSIAYGYVIKPWTIDPNFARDIYREAQDKMIETKIKMHRESSSEL